MRISGRGHLKPCSKYTGMVGSDSTRGSGALRACRRVGAGSFAEVRYGRKEDKVCLEGNLDRLGQSWTRREEKVAVGGTEPGSLE